MTFLTQPNSANETKSIKQPLVIDTTQTDDCPQLLNDSPATIPQIELLPNPVQILIPPTPTEPKKRLKTEKLYSCQECEKSFSQQAHLQIHQVFFFN